MTDRLHWKHFFSELRPVQFRRWESRSDHYAHDHDFFELVLVTAGSGRHLSVDGSRDVTTGDVIFLVPGVWHEYSGCASLAGYDCCFGKELLYRELAWLTDDPVLGGLMLRNPGSPSYRKPVTARLDHAAMSLLEPLLATIAEPADGDAGQVLRQVANRRPMHPGDGVRQQLFGALLVLLGRFLAALDPQTVTSSAVGPSPGLQKLVRRTMAVMEEDLTVAWTLEGLAAHLEATPSLLARAFRIVAGRPPMGQYRRCRMEHAAMLLLRSDLPVAEVGARVGIFDANYFARCFRAELGLQPSVYRSRFRADDVANTP